MVGYQGAGNYHILNRAAGTAADLYNGDSTPETTIDGWAEGNGNPNQLWYIAPVDDGSGTYTIRNNPTGSHMIAPSSSGLNNSLTGGRRDSSGLDRWVITLSEAGYATIASKATGYVLDLSYSSSNNNTSITVFKPHGGNNQMWNLKLII